MLINKILHNEKCKRLILTIEES